MATEPISYIEEAKINVLSLLRVGCTVLYKATYLKYWRL